MKFRLIQKEIHLRSKTINGIIYTKAIKIFPHTNANNWKHLSAVRIIKNFHTFAIAPCSVLMAKIKSQLCELKQFYVMIACIIWINNKPFKLSIVQQFISFIDLIV